jgi:hypothetical protein
MRHRSAGGENLYDADVEIKYNEKQLAVFAYMFNLNPNNIDSIDIEDIVSGIRNTWKYGADNSGKFGYSSNSISFFMAKKSTQLTDRARKAIWNYNLAKAAQNG